jgi:hypothetical protein
MSHGDRWNSFDGNTESTIERWLPILLAEGKLVPDGLPRDADRSFAILDHPATDLRSVANVAKGDEGRMELVSAFPVAFRGVRHRMRILAIHEEPESGEARIEAEFSGNGPTISFFEPYWMANRSQYAIGAMVTVELAALAYNAAMTSSEPAWIENPETIRALRSRDGGDPTDLSPIAVHLDGAAILLPIEGLDPEDYSYQGQVKEVRWLDLASWRILALTLTVMRTESDLDLVLYIPPHALKVTPPHIGEDISGALWLQGRAVDRS